MGIPYLKFYKLYGVSAVHFPVTCMKCIFNPDSLQYVKVGKLQEL